MQAWESAAGLQAGTCWHRVPSVQENRDGHSKFMHHFKFKKEGMGTRNGKGGKRCYRAFKKE